MLISETVLGSLILCVSILQVFFTSTLLGTGENWTLMKSISATEYLNYEAGELTLLRSDTIIL